MFVPSSPMTESSPIATILPKPLQGEELRYFSTEPSGTWSVAEPMGDLLKALLSVDGTSSTKQNTFDRLIHSANADRPILVTLSGMCIVVNPQQP